ncbi:MAG: aldo/keto reductase [Gammaproteobacteria bacterium]|nr:aldo/keto reductase [Gammaproteobacteria bacterium]
MDLRPLGSTGIDVSPLGLGTVKFGRNQQVKYPRAFDLPDDRSIVDLLALARDLGINLLDTAPAYGTSQQRLGGLLGDTRGHWVIVSKVGEIFEHGESRFDFSYAHTVATVEDSLRTLRTDYLDCVLIHSDGDDLRIFDEGGAVDALHELKRRGLIRTHGMSTKTVAGGLRTLAEMDVVMATCNLEYNDELPVLVAAQAQAKGVLIKKGLMSGHVHGADGVEKSFAHVFAQPGVSSMIVGTINPAHLRSNVAALERVLAAAG